MTVKIIRSLLVLAHVFVLTLLAGATLNSVVSPQTFPWLNILSLTFPALMIVNAILIIIWIVLRKKRAILFIALTLLMINPIRRWVNFSPESLEKANLKVLTMNIKGGKYGREEVYNYLKDSGADVIFAQEYASEFNVPGYPHRTNTYYITALNSRTELIHHEKIPTTQNGEAFFADIKINGKMIRFINVYLNPFMFEKSKVKPADDLNKNKQKLRYIAATLIPTFKAHQSEVEIIKNTIKKSPYPVILAGDFNSVPNSYEYYQLSDGLQDAFVEVGRGNATSFHDYKVPIRIDYIFCSPEIIPVSYRVDRRKKLSDHYPVIAEFKIE